MYYVLVAPFSRTCDKLTALYLVLLERVGGQKHSIKEKQLYRGGQVLSKKRSLFLKKDLWLCTKRRSWEGETVCQLRPEEKGNGVSQQLSGANTGQGFEEIQMERSEKYKRGDVGNTNAAARGWQWRRGQKLIAAQCPGLPLTDFATKIPAWESKSVCLSNWKQRKLGTCAKTPRKVQPCILFTLIIVMEASWHHNGTC